MGINEDITKKLCRRQEGSSNMCVDAVIRRSNVLDPAASFFSGVPSDPVSLGSSGAGLIILGGSRIVSYGGILL